MGTDDRTGINGDAILKPRGRVNDRARRDSFLIEDRLGPQSGREQRARDRDEGITGTWRDERDDALGHGANEFLGRDADARARGLRSPR